MDILNLLVLIATVSSFCWSTTGALETCSTPTDRCLPIRNCPKYHKRVNNMEHMHNLLFRQELRQRICRPEVVHDKTPHMCCPKKEIGCELNGERGVCLLREQCPKLHSTTESKLLASPKQNLCFVHDQKNYFCCTEKNCVRFKNLCDQPVSSGPTQPSSAFPECSSTGKRGTEVPKKLCDYKTSLSQLDGQEQTVCCIQQDSDRLINHHRAAHMAKLPCGAIDLLDRIQHGTFAQRGEFPWMAYLVYNDKRVCSGTLIHPSYVLTALHCVTDMLRKVRLGEYNLLEEAITEPQEISIRQKIRSSSYDIALLRLSRPASVDGAMVRPICLPLFANLRMLVPKMLTLTGWGKTETEKLSSVLMKADSPVIPSNGKGCARYEICVGGKNHSNQCSGDSGGPYQAQSIFNGSSRFVQYGVISHGSWHCANQQQPSKAVMVGYVVDWILDNMVL